MLSFKCGFQFQIFVGGQFYNSMKKVVGLWFNRVVLGPVLGPVVVIVAIASLVVSVAVAVVGPKRLQSIGLAPLSIPLTLVLPIRWQKEVIRRRVR